MCVYMYIYISDSEVHVYTYIYTHIYTHMYTHTYKDIYTHAYTQIYKHIYTHIYVHIHISYSEVHAVDEFSTNPTHVIAMNTEERII